jgi:ATP phosphoribosyltransferase regulatory subunit HisZ
LQKIDAALDRSLARFVLVLDDFDDENRYYTGLRFRIYSSGGNRLGGGGRYDALYRTFGADVAAVGFTLTLDQLEAMESAEAPQLRVAGGSR